MRKDRRMFVQQLGCLSIGFSMLPTPTVLAESFTVAKKVERNLSKENVNAWLEIRENGRVLIYTGKLELGQGIKTAVAQIAAEELNMRLDLIDVQMAETEVTPDEGFTAASMSIESSGMSIRLASATAREILLKMASDSLNLPKESLKMEDGNIFGVDKMTSLFELLNGQHIEGKIDENVEIKAKTVRKYVGQPVPRSDIEAMVRGQSVFVQDLRFPGMLHARVVHPPKYTAKITHFDEENSKNWPNLVQLIRKDHFIGVVAEKEFEAIQLAEKIGGQIKWNSGQNMPEQKELKNHLKNLPVEEEVQENKGDVGQSSKTMVSRSFFKPYLMHAANGPSCAVAFFDGTVLHVWSHCQGTYPLRRTLANFLEMPEEKVHVKAVPGSGCFGHNGANDVATEAALIALELPNKHIRLQWSREDENAWEPYGTAMIVDIEASLDTNGKIATWDSQIWSDGHSNRPNSNPNTLLPSRFMNKDYGHHGIGYRGGAWRNAAPYYSVPNLRVTSHMFLGPLRVSSLRSLGTYTNIFAIESVIDDLAEKAGKDPIEFRIEHLDDPRAVECIRKLQDKIKSISVIENEGLGVSFSRYKNETSYCAMAAKVSVERKTGQVKIQKLWAVVDAGETINPDGLKNQTEGGMIQSASWALKEEVKFSSKGITSLNWASYPILRYPEIPEVEVEILDRVEQRPVGAGEASMAPTTAAIVNAIYKATGVRIVSLPVDKELLKV
ncbi:MAG: aldehyde dehydrogenase [Pseudozobellia sp.]|nr:aldehyde dehydrogenase [Pseudozobellia sp.]MBG49976.1 aldehyde dehydrogenase [Pseudozobellia sp.]|tara:strand:- start:790373 stop:792547 length:2175 start_codon:yes stop_codon:yes gene_type:complete